ncbi:MAG: PQQ-binding-like beta-propeller repeat protein, partial [Planctomycetales bacterium]|nr:PQQ-binding-like beta-propeller repeat protein [Planctomycetales bacterium]
LPGEAWADSTATIAGGKVLVTPVEEEQILCLDLIEGTPGGKPIWVRPRGEGLYVACVHNDRAVIVGKSELVALSMTDGEVVWKTPLPGGVGVMPSGRGFRTDDQYFLPLTSGQIAVFDLREGKVVETVATRGVLGNTVCYHDAVISQGATELSSFYQFGALERIVAERLAARADDAWALARRAELRLKAGRRSEALADLRRSQELSPDDSTKELLVSTLLSALQDDFAANQQLAVEVDGLIDRRDQRTEYLRLMAVGMQSLGRGEDALKFYFKAMDESQQHAGSSAYPTDENQMRQAEPGRRVRSQRWLRAQLVKLFHEAAGVERDRMNREVARRLDQAVASGSIVELRHCLEFFGSHPSADGCRLALASRLWLGGEMLEAELILADLLDSPRPETAAAATAQVARLLNDAGNVEESAVMYRRLATVFADVNCGEGKTGREVCADLAPQSVVARRLAEAPHWPNGRLDVAEFKSDDENGPRLGYTSYQRVYPCDVREAKGPLPEGMRLVLDRNRHVILRDGFGKELVAVQLDGSETSRYYTTNYSMTHARMSGHLAILSLGYELFAIDLLHTTANSGQRVLWKQDLSDPVSSKDSNTGQQIVPKLHGNAWGGHRYEAADSDGKPIAALGGVSRQGVVLQRWDQLVCVDPLDADIVHWTRDGVPAGCDVFGDDEVVVVAPRDATSAMVLSALDGEQLGTVDVPAAPNRWLTVGRRMLRWENADNGVAVAWLDPWDAAARQVRSGKQAVVWSHDFSSGAKGTIVAGEDVVVQETSGAVTILDIATGAARVQAKVAALPEITSLYALRGEREYTLIANTSIDDAPRGITVQPAPGGYGPLGQYSPLIKGNVNVLSRATGEPLWSTAASIEHFGLPLDQPSLAPLLTFMRNYSPDTGSPSRTWKTEILCIDKRDGRSVFRHDDISGTTQVYRLEAAFDADSAALMLPDRSFVMTFTDEPRPPEPPAQVESNVDAATPDP